MTKIQGQNYVKNILKLCLEGFSNGWHERSGGNVSYRLTEDEASLLRDIPGKWHSLGVSALPMAGQHFLVTTSGSYMQNVSSSPEDNLCIIKVNESGDSYKVLWGLNRGGKPTSELESHLMCFCNVVDPDKRVIYHAHPANTISASFLLPDSQSFTTAIWGSMIECLFIFPRGIAVIPPIIPGGVEIATLTSEKIGSYDAIVWAHHGLLCMGKDTNDVFSLMHTVEKAAGIFMDLTKVGVHPTPEKTLLEQADFMLGGILRKEFC